MKMLHCIAVFITFLSIGCTHIAKEYEIEPIFAQYSDLLNSTNSTPIDTVQLKNRIDSAKNQTQRNELIDELIMISDVACSCHQSQIIANSNTWNIATGTVTNMLSALGTVVGGPATKSALAAGTAFSSGSRSLINEEVYAKSIGTTIVRAINQSRDSYYAAIQAKTNSTIEHYSVRAALRDVQEYHRRCSFYYGLLEISKALEQRQKTKMEIDKDIQKLKEHQNGIKNDNNATQEINNEINRLIIQQVTAPN